MSYFGVWERRFTRDPCVGGMVFLGAVRVSFLSCPLPFHVLLSRVAEDGVGVKAQCEGAVQGFHLAVFECWDRGDCPRGEVGPWGGAVFLPVREVLISNCGAQVV